MKKDDATYSETPVEISGSEDQIKKAKEMIEQIIGPDSSVTNNMGGMTSSQYHEMNELYSTNIFRVDCKYMKILYVNCGCTK